MTPREVMVEPGFGRMSPIGSKREAILAREGRLREVGAGAFKTVYESPNGKVVYKTSHADDDSWLIDEFEGANRLRAQGHRWASPTSLYRFPDGVVITSQPAYTVLAHIDYDSPLYWNIRDRADKLEEDGLVGDVHPWNIGATPKGHLRIFDGLE